MSLRVASLALALVLSACAAQQKPRVEVAELKTIVEPPTARVQVDERFVGAARVLAKRPVRLSPGKHRLTVEAEGYFPHDMELDLPKGVTEVDLKLRPIPR